MQRKIFISINLTDRDKKRLIRATEKWQDLPVKWVKEQNLHITLSFLGHVADDVILKICAKVRKASDEKDIFDIEFDRIEIGPSAEDQKFIWLSGEPNEDLKSLVEALEKELGMLASEKKSFRPHITLGRIRKNKWEALEESPKILEKFPLTITAESVDVMASEFENEGQEYTVIESYLLK